MVGRLFLAFLAAITGIVGVLCILNGRLFFPDWILAWMGIFGLASLLNPLTAALMAAELVALAIFIRSESKWWLLPTISALTGVHTYYFSTVIQK